MNNFPNFDNVVSPELRAWNRLNMNYNIKQLMGPKPAAKYVKQFSNGEKANILTLGNRVVMEGYENVRREIIRKNNG